MIKKIFGLILLAVVFTSCGDDTPTNQVEQDGEELVDNFTITGSIKNHSNSSVQLEAMSPNGMISVADAKTDASGAFELKGNIPAFGLYQLKLGESDENIIPLTMVPNDNLTIKASVETFTTTPQLSGTKWSRVMSDYMKIYSDFHTAQTELIENNSGQSNLEINKQYKLLKAPVDSFAIAEMLADPANPFNIVLSSSATPTMGLNDWDPENLKVLNKVHDAYMKNYPNSAITTSLSSQIYQIETNYKQHVANTSGRLPAPEIALNNPDGVELKLSSLKGKYVLVDFWASWCGPCRRENPNVVRLYNKYKNKGFTVFSVSLDDNAEAWKAAIKKDGLAWPNHVSDLLKWNSPLPQLYGFSGIPHTVLLNTEGNVIGVGLRGESLEQKLNEIFSN